MKYIHLQMVTHVHMQKWELLMPLFLLWLCFFTNAD